MKISKNLVADLAIFAMTIMLLQADANAQNALKTAAQSGATAVYEVFGVISVLAILFFAINLKFQFIQNALKHFMTTCAAIALGFAAPTFVSWLKTLFGATSINSL